MRRIILTAAAATLLLAGCGSDDESRVTRLTRLTRRQRSTSTTPGDPEATPELAEQVVAMRAATARYANDPDAALDDGFFMITQHIEDMGYHFLNPRSRTSTWRTRRSWSMPATVNSGS